jgi:hypothetical protein
MFCFEDLNTALVKDAQGGLTSNTEDRLRAGLKVFGVIDLNTSLLKDA